MSYTWSQKAVLWLMDKCKETFFPKTGGIMTGNINMCGNGIFDLSDPEYADQAVNKAYVDGKRITYSTTIPASWEGSGPYTLTIPVEGLLGSDMPHIIPVYSDDAALAAAQMEAWSCVSVGKAAAGGIVFTCLDSKPGTEIPIQIEVMR